MVVISSLLRERPLGCLEPGADNNNDDNNHDNTYNHMIISNINIHIILNTHIMIMITLIM